MSRDQVTIERAELIKLEAELAEATAMLSRIVKYAREDRAPTPEECLSCNRELYAPAAHAETRKALEESEAGWHEQRERAQDLEQQCGVLLEELSTARAARAVAESAAAGLGALLESTRAELAKAEARVKELETKLDSI